MYNTRCKRSQRARYALANTRTHWQTGAIQGDMTSRGRPIIHNLFIETTHDKGGWEGDHGRRSGEEQRVVVLAESAAV